MPGWPRPVVERANQPPVTPPQPGTYGKAAVAQAAHSFEAPAHYWSSSDTPADQVTSTPAHSLGGKHTPGTPGRPVRLSGPSHGRQTRPGPWGFGTIRG